ncbi:MAG: hypothetical protein EON59_15130 [Alphaproteobacteria bacterium]|nr:MAG: hypothetical protein EON59_15130 [Alphaproteobacteria bacterium]
MSAAAPWSVKGIDPKAREVAKDLARRSGMTLGEWLNSMIMEDEEEGYATLPRRSQASEYERRNRSRRLDDAYDVAEDNGHRILPDNLGFVFISSKTELIQNNDDLSRRIEIIELNNEDKESEDHSLDYLLSKIQIESAGDYTN